MDEMQTKEVGSRFVELSVITYGNYLRFNNGSIMSGRKFGRLEDNVSEDNKEKCLVMRGLPFRITVEEIITFFKGFGNITEANIFIEENQDGERTGSALVIFKSEEEAKDAKASRHKKKIGFGKRWVELYDCHDQFMQKICGLHFNR